MAESALTTIKHKSGVYTARHEPRAELVLGDEPYVMVLFTHDYGLAAELAWPLWNEDRWEDDPPRRIERPCRVWVRRVPDQPHGDFAFLWHYAEPGHRGVMPAVEFVPPYLAPSHGTGGMGRTT